METLFCSNCQTEFSGSRTSCPRCGSRVRQPRDATRPPGPGAVSLAETGPAAGVSVAVCEEVPERIRPLLSALEGDSKTGAGGPTPLEGPAEGEGKFRGDPMIGRALGGCIIQGVLGRGAMGAVYRANQLNLDRIVALKTIREDFCANKVFLERFQQEARAVGRFSTPHVVQIHHVGCDQGVHFLVMEYVSGGNLGSYTRRKSGQFLKSEDALRLLRQCCEGLLEAERLEIVHRDIKPQNLLLDQNGNVKIADFGIAKFLGASVKMTAGPGVLGTPLYMSPEQAQGKRLDHRSDMYSLGATFYHLLTGALPVEGDSVYAVLQQKNQIEYLSPARIEKCHAPEALTRVIEKMTALHPESRYESFQDLLDDLDRIAAGTDPLAATPRIRRRPGGSKRIAVALVLASVLGSIGVLGQLYRREIESWIKSGWPVIQWLAPAPPPATAVAAAASGDSPTGSDAALDSYRWRLESLETELRERLDFDTLARVAALIADLDDSPETARAADEEVDRLRADADALYRRSLPAILERCEARLAALRARVERGAEDGDFESIAEEATEACLSIPEGLEGTGSIRAALEALRSDMRAGIDLRSQLHQLELDETASLFEPPFELALEHWRKIERRLDAIRAPGKEFAAWIARERDRRRAAIVARVLPALDRLRRATLAEHEKFQRGEVEIESFESAVAELEDSRERLIAASWVEPRHWKAVVSDETLHELKRAVTDRRAAQEVAGELAERARRYLKGLLAVSSLAEWQRTERAMEKEATFVDTFGATVQKTPGSASGDTVQVLADIRALRESWREHGRLFAGALGTFSRRQLFSARGAAALEALRRSDRSLQDASAQALLRASDALLSSRELLVDRLDLIAGEQRFELARRELASLADFPEDGVHAGGVRAAAAYVQACQDSLRELRELVAGMAPVPAGTVRIPGRDDVAVRGFYIDRFEVSVGEYRDFVAAMKAASYDQVRSLWPDRRAFEVGRELPRYLRESRQPVLSTWPIEEVTHDQALAYLHWRSPHVDLFTLEEWWLATRGDASHGRDHRPLRDAQSSIHDDADRPLPVRQDGEVLGFPPSLSVHHLADNVAEWCKLETAGGRPAARLAGCRYLDGLRSDRVPPLRRPDTVAAGHGFRGIVRVAEVFGGLLGDQND